MKFLRGKISSLIIIARTRGQLKLYIQTHVRSAGLRSGPHVSVKVQSTDHVHGLNRSLNQSHLIVEHELNQ